MQLSSIIIYTVFNNVAVVRLKNETLLNIKLMNYLVLIHQILPCVNDGAVLLIVLLTYTVSILLASTWLNFSNIVSLFQSY